MITRAKRIEGCTASSARTSRGPFKLMSLRRRKLRLILPVQPKSRDIQPTKQGTCERSHHKFQNLSRRMRAVQSLAGTVNGSIIDWLAAIASGPALLITWSEQFVPDGVVTGLEILLRAFLPNWSGPMVQQTPVRTSQSIAKMRHQLPAMPFHPANFVHRQFVLPTARPFPAYTSEFAVSRRVSCPEFSRFRRR